MTTLTDRQSWTQLMSSIMGAVVAVLSVFRFTFKYAERIAKRGFARTLRPSVALPGDTVLVPAGKVVRAEHLDALYSPGLVWSSNPVLRGSQFPPSVPGAQTVSCS